MAQAIVHIQEPARLVLAWQSPDETGDRTRFAVGELRKDVGETVTLHYYENTPDVQKAKSLGYLGYPAFSLARSVHTKDVLAAFMRRLPPRSRSDFHEYTLSLRLNPFAHISNFALLGYSEAKLPSDGFSLVDTLEDKTAPFEFLLELAGCRYYPPPLSSEDIGKLVTLCPEPTNKYDPNAVMTQLSGRTIGYVNRLQAPALRSWVQSERISAVVQRLNGKPGRPRVFIFISVR